MYSQLTKQSEDKIMAIPSNTIATLKRIQVKPLSYNVEIDDDGKHYILLATYVKPERGEYFPICTARGPVKKYKSIEAAIADARKVEPELKFTATTAKERKQGYRFVYKHSGQPVPEKN